MKKLFLTLLLSFLFLFSTATTTQAAFPPSLYLGQAVPIFFEWKPSVRAYFIILQNVKSVSYNLTYKANDIPQGVTGSFTVTNKKTVSRDIFLGTCSGSNCVAHSDIEDLELEVTFTYKDNHTETKLYHL